MKENAILIRHLDVIKVHVDFSNDDDIYRLLNAERISTIHTRKTQELSKQLGFHLVVYVDREGHDINNNLACSISGYDYLGSFMLLFKTDDKFNSLPLEENELESLYNYLTSGDVLEETYDNEATDEDQLLRYVLMLDVNIKWPKLNDYACAYKLCVPVIYFDNKENVNIPYLADEIEYLGIDRINNVLELRLHFGEVQDIKLQLDKPEKFEFKYQRYPDNEESYREVTINFELKHFVWIATDYTGRIHIKEELYSNKEPVFEEKTFVNYKDDSGDFLYSSISANTFYPLLIDENRKIVIVYAYRKDYKDENIIVNTYFPVYLDSEATYYEAWKDEDSGEIFRHRITITYEE